MREWVIGRDPNCELTVEHPSVSRRHAELRALEGGRFALSDLGSTNGTFVLEGEDWRRVTTAEIAPDTPLRLGQLRATAVELIAAADRAGGPPAENPTRMQRRRDEDGNRGGET